MPYNQNFNFPQQQYTWKPNFNQLPPWVQNPSTIQRPQEDWRFNMSGGLAPSMEGYKWSPLAGTAGALVKDPTQGGSGLPNNLMSQLGSLIASLKGTGSQMPTPPMMAGGNAGDQYLAEIRGLLGKMGGGLGALTPEMAAEFAQRKAAMRQEIEDTFRKEGGRLSAGLYAGGMEDSSNARAGVNDLANMKSSAVSNMLSNLFNDEMGLRQSIGQSQQQGILSQVGVLQQLMQNAQQRDLQNQQFGQQNFENQLQLNQSEDQRKMQILNFFMDLLKQFGGKMPNNFNLSAILG